MKYEWRNLTEQNVSDLNQAQKMVHQAVQFISMVGRQIIEQEEDDSNSSMQWLPEQNMLAGQFVNGIIRVGFSYDDFSLNILNSSGEAVRSKDLDGLSMKAVFSWLKMELIMNGALAQDLELKLHYKIPPHPVNRGEEFRKPASDLLKELCNHRNNAHAALQAYGEDCEFAGPVLTWPHHFDTGVYIPIEKDEQGNPFRAFSMGYAIADDLMDEAYFYVTQWVEKGKLNYASKPELNHGTWHPGGLAGAALAVSEIISSQNQKACLDHFLSVTKKWSYDAEII
jgi:hypothetical protein